MAADVLLKNLPSPLFAKEGKFLPLEKGGEEGFMQQCMLNLFSISMIYKTLKRVQGDSKNNRGEII
jgi:hypothetical protein